MGEIRFVGTGETHGYPYLVCKKNLSVMRKVELLAVTTDKSTDQKMLIFNLYLYPSLPQTAFLLMVLYLL